MVCAVALAWLVSAPLASAQRADKVLLPGPSDVPRAKRLADEPASPADYRSPHFLLHTDLPKDEAGELLGKLERMVALVSKYWGQPLRGEIECYVVADLDCWPAEALSPAGRAKVRLKSGITTTRTLSRGPQFISGKSIVYAAADGGTPQHEVGARLLRADVRSHRALVVLRGHGRTGAVLARRRHGRALSSRT